MYKILVVLLLCMGISHADNYNAVTWTDLEGKIEMYDDPFKKLTEDQLYNLSMFVRIKEMEQRSPKRVNEKMHKRMKAAESTLKKEGVDIDYLISQRERIKNLRKKAAYTANTDLNNTDISMGGFMLALNLEKGKTSEFLLVPTVGACIHTPPPPPNQIVYIRSKIPVEPKSQFEAVTVKGKMIIEDASNNLFLVDGSSDISSGYSLHADTVEKFQIEK